MGVRGEIYSTKVLLSKRAYFFNVKETRTGDLFLNIVESKNNESGNFERQSVIIFEEDLQPFLKGFDESLKTLEKTIREKKRAAPPKNAPLKGAPHKNAPGTPPKKPGGARQSLQTRPAGRKTP